MAIFFPRVAPNAPAPRKRIPLNTSTTSGYAAAALLSTVLLLVLTTARAEDETGLLSWGQLQKKAGYFSESGRWRGGLPKKERNEGDVWSNCLERHNNVSFCKKWEEKGESAQAFRNGTCDCIEEKDSYCHGWKCISEEKERYCSEGSRKDRKSSPKCKKGVEMLEDCQCLEEKNESSAYCWKWRCTENDGDSTTRRGDYFCHETSNSNSSTLNSSTTSCVDWSGELTSSSDVESISCECTIDEDGLCENWECNVRTLLRCSEHKGGWCHLELSIGVFGVIGFLFLVGGMVLIFSFQCSRRANREMQLKILTIYTIFLVLPWFAGVAISGGVEGIGWVILMWAIPFIVLAAIIVPWSTMWQNLLTTIKNMRSSTRLSGNGDQAAPSSSNTAPLVHSEPGEQKDKEGINQPSGAPDSEIRRRDPDTGELLNN